MPTARRHNDGGFTPRQFPLDPFVGERSASREPWSLDASKLPSDDDLTTQRNVVLVLGEPPLDAIEPLLHSPHLSSSLLILATSRVYDIPLNTCPDVRVLRLGVSLASSDSGASRLVAVLQWADRIACAWRADATPPQIQELAEDGATAGYATPPRRTSWFGTAPTSSAPPSPASSELGLALTSSHPRSLSQSSKRASTIDGSPMTNSAQRSFDALFDFLPPSAADRHLLKHAILVTTVARPFLTCTAPEPPPTPKRTKRFSLRSRPPAPALQPTATPTPAHIVHLIPPTRSSLVRPLESFCLSFSFPSASAHSAPSLGVLHGPIGGPGAAPRPYVMPPAALADVLHAHRKWTLAELILCGALDSENESVDEWGVKRREGISLRSLAKSNRAWINGVGDLVLDGAKARERVTSEQPAPPPRAMSDPSMQPSRSRRATVQPSSLSPSVAQPPRGEPYSWHVQPGKVTSPGAAHVRQHSQTRRTATALASHPSTSSSSSHSHSHTSASTVTVQASTWPTPPSSESSSPSTSPDLDAKPRNGVVTTIKGQDRNGGAQTGLRTPRRDDKDGGSSKASGSVKKRKGLFAWMKR